MSRFYHEQNQALQRQIDALAQIPDDIRNASREELDARLDAYRSGNTRRAAPMRETDLEEAHAQVMAAMTRGTRPSHPLAIEMLANGRAPTMLDLATQYSIHRAGDPARSWDPRQVLAYAANTSHLANIVAQTANTVALQRGHDLLAKARRITRTVELKDYRPVTVANIELIGDVPPPRTVLQEWATPFPRADATEMALATSPLRLRFTEAMSLADDFEGFARMVEAVTIAAAQNELRWLFGMIQANPDLPDGQPLFSEAGGNLVEGTPSKLVLELAVNALRRQKVNYQAADIEPSLLLVPTQSEGHALELVKEKSVSSPWLEVVPTSYLTESSPWFLCADPAQWPQFLRGVARGSNGQTLRFAPGSVGADEADRARDIIVEAMHTVTYAVAPSRVGCVRMGITDPE